MRRKLQLCEMRDFPRRRIRVKRLKRVKRFKALRQIAGQAALNSRIDLQRCN
jgi:hypothetical protein